MTATLRSTGPVASGAWTALVAVLVLALAVAPATAGIDVRPGAALVDDARDAPDTFGAGASLAARWPLLLDASQRTAIGAGVERALDLPRRGLLVALPAVARPRVAPLPEADPRPRDLSMFGRRQTDGG